MVARDGVFATAILLIALPVLCAADSGYGIEDYLAIESLVTGPGCPCAPAARPFDTDADGDLDLADLTAFQRDFAGPHIAQTQNGPCLALRDPNTPEPCGGDVVTTEIEGHTLHIVHGGAFYNCCPEPFAHTVAIAGTTITIDEYEVLVNPCFCMCCYEIETWVESVPSGTYTVEFCWEESDSRDCDVQVVVVP